MSGSDVDHCCLVCGRDTAHSCGVGAVCAHCLLAWPCPEIHAQALADGYRDAMSEPLTEDQQAEAIRYLDTIAAGSGDVPPMRGLGVPHVSDLTPEEASDSAPCCPQIAKTGVCYCQEDDRG